MGNLKQITLTGILIFFCFAIQAQQPIKIQIKDSQSGTGLSQANITFLATGEVYKSNKYGGLTITLLGQQDSVRVSHASYHSKSILLKIDGREHIDVFLDPLNNIIQEVQVFTGYQRIPKERATGSFDLITQSQLSKQVKSNILERLVPITSAMLVDDQTRGGGLMIRGVSTIRGNRSPLIILDNFPYEGDINSINPEDIESVTILKDAAAASIWGARAGNGVIVIQSKKGRYESNLKIDLTSNLSLTPKPHMYMHKIGTVAFMEMEEELFDQGFYNANLQSNRADPVSSFVDLLYLKKGGALTNDAFDKKKKELQGYSFEEQYRTHILQTALEQRNTLSFQSGGQRYRSRMSFNFQDQKNALKELTDQWNIQSSQSFSPLKNLEINFDGQFSFNKVKSGYPASGELGNGILYPYTAFKDIRRNDIPFYPDYRGSYLEGLKGSGLLDWSYLPLQDVEHNKSEAKNRQNRLNFAAVYRSPIGLTAEVQYQYADIHNDNFLNYGIESYYTRNLVNGFAQRVGNDLKFVVPKGDIYEFDNTRMKVQNLRGMLRYDKNILKHGINLLAGAELRKTLSDRQLNRLYGVDGDILTSTPVDYINSYKDYVSQDSRFIPNRQSMQGTDNRYVSFFANGAYNFKDRYTLSASARQDASNIYGVNTRNKWSPFWSFGVGWQIDKEPFFQINWIDRLKLRLSQGTSGNTDPNASAVTTIQYTMTSPYTLGPIASFNSYNNPDLRWERVRTQNVGLDFSILSNKITGSIEYYHKKADDLLGTAVVDYSAGIGGSMIKNVAEIKGKGIDVQLRTQNIQRNFSWSTSMNFSHNSDEVVDYYLTNTQGSSFVNGGVSGIKGRPVNSVFSYKWNGLSGTNGLPIGYLNGVESQDYRKITGKDTQVEDLQYHGSSRPTYFGGLINSFSYRGIQLELALTYKLGYYFRTQALDYAERNIGLHESYAQRWKVPGDEMHTQIPAFNLDMFPFYRSVSAHVHRADHVRFQYINLSYAIAKDKLKGHEITCFINVDNLGDIWVGNDEKLNLRTHRSGSMSLPPTYSIGTRITLNK